MNTTAIQEIEQAIQYAFANVPYPGLDQVTLPSTDWQVDHWRNDYFPDGIDSANVTPTVIASAQYHLQFFTPAARRYYMPALLRGALHDGCRFVVYMLRPPPDMTLFVREYGDYELEQKEAIQRFLQHIRRGHPDNGVQFAAADALQRFWTHFVVTPAPTLETPPGRKDDLANALVEAFASVPYPGDENLRGNSGKEIQRDFKGYTPFTIPCDVFAYYSDEMYGLNPKGRQYYLPRYIRASLEDFRATVTHTLLWRLLDAKDPAYAAEWFDFYSPEQKRAISHYIEYVRDEALQDEYPELSLAPDASLALDAYWRHA